MLRDSSLNNVKKYAPKSMYGGWGGEGGDILTIRDGVIVVEGSVLDCTEGKHRKRKAEERKLHRRSTNFTTHLSTGRKLLQFCIPQSPHNQPRPAAHRYASLRDTRTVKALSVTVGWHPAGEATWTGAS